MSTQRNSVSPRRAKIIEVLEEAGEALQIREIVDRTGMDYNNARSALSEMTTMNLLARVHRGVYDLPARVEKRDMESPEHPLHKILLNQQILKVLLNIVITNKALMEALLLGQQEIIRAIRLISPETEEGEEAIKNLEEIFAKRVEWHFDIAAEQVAEQYTKLPEEVFDVLVAPLARDSDGQASHTLSMFRKKGKSNKKKSSERNPDSKKPNETT
ncbi:MAG: hypothetical protein WD035_08575 [Balneolaceae bacterium]